VMKAIDYGRQNVDLASALKAIGDTETNILRAVDNG